MLQLNLFSMKMDKANLRMYIVSDSFKNVAVTNLFTLMI